MPCCCSRPGTVRCESLHHQVSKYEANQNMFVDESTDLYCESWLSCVSRQTYFSFSSYFLSVFDQKYPKHITYWLLIPLVKFREPSSSLVWAHLLAQILFELFSDECDSFFPSLPKKHMKIHLECPKWYHTYLPKISHQIAIFYVPVCSHSMLTVCGSQYPLHSGLCFRFSYTCAHSAQSILIILALSSVFLLPLSVILPF